MDIIDKLLPVLTLVVGLLLSELGHYLRARREKTAALARAISDLLEIRHRILVTKLVSDELKKRFQVPEDAFTQLRTFLSMVLPEPQGLHDRYDQAVSEIASHDPVLGFKMRSQNAIPQFLSALESVAAGDVSAKSILAQIEQQILDSWIPMLDERIRKAASLHGVLTRFEVNKLLRKSNSLPAEAESLFHQLEETLRRSKGS
ncbi:MAG: hypothetical protein L0338_07835 [Acidobacteria bacterium]|nr:hypothetical protein [Acidobacteriota bacterium]